MPFQEKTHVSIFRRLLLGIPFLLVSCGRAALHDPTIDAAREKRVKECFAHAAHIKKQEEEWQQFQIAAAARDEELDQLQKIEDEKEKAWKSGSGYIHGYHKLRIAPETEEEGSCSRTRICKMSCIGFVGSIVSTGGGWGVSILWNTTAGLTVGGLLLLSCCCAPCIKSLIGRRSP